MASLLRFMPVIIGFAILAIFAIGLTLGPPQNIDSAYQDKPLPMFTLPALEDGAGGLSTAMLQTGQPALLNIFASWCAPCRVEHPLLMQLAAQGVPIYAINYKDGRAAAQRFVNRLGNPYRAIGFDKRGATALNLGVYGVPETFIIDGRGHVLHRHVGPLMPEDVQNVILPYFTDNPKEAQNAVSR